MNKLKKILKKFNIKKRLGLYSFLVLILMIFSFCLLKVYSTYNSTATINPKVEKAIYILNEDNFSFNIDIDGITPSDDPYIYQFSISNYKEDKKSNVDLMYKLDFKTTTNLPLEYRLYRNQVYNSSDSTNLFSLSSIIQDEDGSWYNKFDLPTEYTFNYKKKEKDIYYLIVIFSKNYSNNINYADLIDNVEITVDAKQILD